MSDVIGFLARKGAPSCKTARSFLRWTVFRTTCGKTGMAASMYTLGRRLRKVTRRTGSRRFPARAGSRCFAPTVGSSSGSSPLAIADDETATVGLCAAATVSGQEVGFLTDYSKLETREAQLGSRVYLVPDVAERLREFDSIAVDQPEIFMATDSKYKGAKGDQHLAHCEQGFLTQCG